VQFKADYLPVFQCDQVNFWSIEQPKCQEGDTPAGAQPSADILLNAIPDKQSADQISEVEKARQGNVSSEIYIAP